MTMTLNRDADPNILGASDTGDIAHTRTFTVGDGHTVTLHFDELGRVAGLTNSLGTHYEYPRLGSAQFVTGAFHGVTFDPLILDETGALEALFECLTS